MDAREDKRFIELLEKEVGVSATSNVLSGFFNKFADTFFDCSSYVMDVKIIKPTEKDLWYGLMIILSVAMTNINEGNKDTTMEIEPLINYFRNDANYHEMVYAMGYILCGTLQNAVSAFSLNIAIFCFGLTSSLFAGCL